MNAGLRSEDIIRSTARGEYPSTLKSRQKGQVFQEGLHTCDHRKGVMINHDPSSQMRSLCRLSELKDVDQDAAESSFDNVLCPSIWGLQRLHTESLTSSRLSIAQYSGRTDCKQGAESRKLRLPTWVHALEVPCHLKCSISLHLKAFSLLCIWRLKSRRLKGYGAR